MRIDRSAPAAHPVCSFLILECSECEPHQTWIQLASQWSTRSKACVYRWVP